MPRKDERSPNHTPIIPDRRGDAHPRCCRTDMARTRHGFLEGTHVHLEWWVCYECGRRLECSCPGVLVSSHDEQRCGGLRAESVHEGDQP